MLTRTGRGLLVGGSFRRRTFQLIAQFLDGFLNCEIGVPARMFLVIAQPGFHEFPLGGGRKLFQFRVDEVKDARHRYEVQLQIGRRHDFESRGQPLG